MALIKVANEEKERGSGYAPAALAGAAAGGYAGNRLSGAVGREIGMKRGLERARGMENTRLEEHRKWLLEDQPAYYRTQLHNERDEWLRRQEHIPVLEEEMEALRPKLPGMFLDETRMHGYDPALGERVKAMQSELDHWDRVRTNWIRNEGGWPADIQGQNIDQAKGKITELSGSLEGLRAQLDEHKSAVRQQAFQAGQQYDALADRLKYVQQAPQELAQIDKKLQQLMDSMPERLERMREFEAGKGARIAEHPEVAQEAKRMAGKLRAPGTLAGLGVGGLAGLLGMYAWNHRDQE